MGGGVVRCTWVILILFSLVCRHTGIVVYGTEYYFGGGIQQTPAGKTPYGTPIRVLDLGVTHVPKDVFEMYLQEISPRYTEHTYSLLTHNCNNFSNEVAQFLVGANIPEYILNLPNEVINSPMGALLCECSISMKSLVVLIFCLDNFGISNFFCCF